MHLTTIKFPEVQLPSKKANKLRKHFIDYFEKNAPEIHKQMAIGKGILKYPLVQYKVIDGTPMFVGINKGGIVLTEHFTKVKEIEVNRQICRVLGKNIEFHPFDITVDENLYAYTFKSMWIAMAHSNYKQQYKNLSQRNKKERLNQILIGNILSFLKSMGIRINKHLITHVDASERPTKYNNQTLNAFDGNFTTNIKLPDFIGLGKGVPQGYGTIAKAVRI